MISELIDPAYLRDLIKTMKDCTDAISDLASSLQILALTGFDDGRRLRVRAEVVDSVSDGYIRVYDASKSVDFVEILKEFSWITFNLAESSAHLSTMPAVIRWGRNVSPFWIYGSEVTAPAANTTLVSRTVTSGKIGYIYGFFITAKEANDFKINWTSGGTARSMRIVFTGAGSLYYVDFVPLNEGLGADGGTSITITNVNAGGSGVVYQAGIFYAEV